MHYLIEIIFILTGATSLSASLLDWNWFFTTQNTQWVVKNVGRKQARLFYGVLGVILIAAGTFFLLSQILSV